MLGAVTAFCATSTPTLAQGFQATVPQPNIVVLLALATAGVFIRRRFAYFTPPKD